MIVDVVSRDVGEQRAIEVKISDSVLHNRVRTDLHEHVLATSFHHFRQQSVQFQRVRRRVCSLDSLIVDIVYHCRQKTSLMSKLPEHLIEQRGCRSLSVRSGYAHQSHFL